MTQYATMLDEVLALRSQLASAKAKLTMLDGTLTLERGFGIDTHATMLEVARKATARQIELEKKLASARRALEDAQAQLQKIVDLKNPMPRAAVREAVAEVLAALKDITT